MISIKKLIHCCFIVDISISLIYLIFLFLGSKRKGSEDFNIDELFASSKLNKGGEKDGKKKAREKEEGVLWFRSGSARSCWYWWNDRRKRVSGSISSTRKRFSIMLYPIQKDALLSYPLVTKLEDLHTAKRKFYSDLEWQNILKECDYYSYF